MPRSLPTPARLEALSDGVIAVILTIMVLELKVPHADGLAGLVTILPTLAIYLLSFAFTGVYWVNHSHLVDRLEHVDHLVLWANLSFLFLLSLLPFFTEYVGDKHLNGLSVQIYAGSLLLVSFGFQFLSAAILRHLCRDGRTEGEAEKNDHVWEIRKGWFSAVFYLVAAAVAHWHPRSALLLVAVVTLIWIVPNFGQRQPETERPRDA